TAPVDPDQGEPVQPDAGAIAPDTGAVTPDTEPVQPATEAPEPSGRPVPPAGGRSGTIPLPVGVPQPEEAAAPEAGGLPEPAAAPEETELDASEAPQAVEPAAPQAAAPDVPVGPPLQELFTRLVDKDPEVRFSGAKALGAVPNTPGVVTELLRLA